jgi:hypothetical protein
MNTAARTSPVTVGAALAALASLTAGPAEAARPPVVDLRGAGLGSHVVDDAGTARLTCRATGEPFDGTYTATLTATDGTLPGPGVCEPATAAVDVAGSRSRFLRLTGGGEVCGEWTDATYVVTHRFVGRYVVSDASARRVRGTDGWYSLVLATEGRANLEAVDT